MKNQTYTQNEKDLYNLMLDLNYSEPYITMDAIVKALGVPRHLIAPVMGSLISKGKVLAGNEDVLGDILHTYTPIVSRGQAYGYPLDYYTYEEWSEFSL